MIMPRLSNYSQFQEKHSEHEREKSDDESKESLAMGRVNLAADLDSEQLQPLPRYKKNCSVW
jgi:hypothetical protein